MKNSNIFIISLEALTELLIKNFKIIPKDSKAIDIRYNYHNETLEIKMIGSKLSNTAESAFILNVNLKDLK